MGPPGQRDSPSKGGPFVISGGRFRRVDSGGARGEWSAERVEGSPPRGAARRVGGRRWNCARGRNWGDRDGRGGGGGDGDCAGGRVLGCLGWGCCRSASLPQLLGGGGGGSCRPASSQLLNRAGRLLRPPCRHRPHEPARGECGGGGRTRREGGTTSKAQQWRWRARGGGGGGGGRGARRQWLPLSAPALPQAAKDGSRSGGGGG